MQVKRVSAVLLASLLMPVMAIAQNDQTLTNAASVEYGVKVSLEVGEGARKDPLTEPMMSFDGSAHSRQVMSGVPYTFTIELADKLPIDHLSLTQSDNASELAPKDVEITLDDGTKLTKTLEDNRPAKNKIAWQNVPIGKDVKTIRVTVLSNYPGDAKVTWGGMGDIAVLTPTNLKEKFAVPGYDPTAPAYVSAAPPTSANGDPPVHLPPVAAAGEHPRLVLGRSEIAELNTSLDSSDEGKKAKAALLSIVDGGLNKPLDFPDPKGPLGQLRDRNDAVAKKHESLALTCGNLGIAYALTGDEKYAARAAEILKGYADRYADYAEHKGVNPQDTGKVMGQRLSEAMWIIPLIEGFDYVYSSKALTDADRTHISDDLIRAAITFIRKKIPADEVAARTKRDASWRSEMPPASDGKPVGNWLLFYNAATMMAGSTLADQDMLDLATADIKMLLRKGIGVDGMWGEGAIGYQFFAINALISGVESAARSGIDLYSFDHDRFKQLFDSPLAFAYPDGTAPGINDSARLKFGDWSTICYDYAWLRYGDPAYAILVNASPRQVHFSTAIYYPTRVFTKLPEPVATEYPSTVFENLGYAILRNDSGYALLKYGQHGGVHGHFDKLNFILFARGDNGKADEIGGEPKFHRYEDALHDQWTKTSIAHNTMTVNERSQSPSAGKLMIFTSQPPVGVMRGESVDAYPGAWLDRTIVQTPEMVIDCYTGRSTTEKTWDRTLRYQGTLDTLVSPTTKPVQPLGRSDGYQHIGVAATIDASEPWRGNWSTSVGTFHVLLAGAPGQQVFAGMGPDGEHLAIMRQQGTSAAFVAIDQMQAWGNPAESVLWIASDEKTHAVSIHQQDGSDTLLVIATAPTWSIGGWSSDARVLYVKKLADHYDVQLCGGTTATGPGGSVKLPAAGNAFVSGAGGTLELTKK